MKNSAMSNLWNLNYDEFYGSLNFSNVNSLYFYFQSLDVYCEFHRRSVRLWRNKVFYRGMAKTKNIQISGRPQLTSGAEFGVHQNELYFLCNAKVAFWGTTLDYFIFLENKPYGIVTKRELRALFAWRSVKNDGVLLYANCKNNHNIIQLNL